MTAILFIFFFGAGGAVITVPYTFGHRVGNGITKATTGARSGA